MTCEPIPELPPRPHYPALQIGDKELKQFVIPLYSRKWGILYGFKQGVVNKNKWYKSAQMAKTFDFTTFEATMDFVTEVARLAQTEDVSSDQLVTIAVYDTYGVSQHFPNIAFEKTRVYVQTYTSAAFQDGHHALTEDLVERQRPGITLRDIRIAILLEETFSRHFLTSRQGLAGERKLRPQANLPQCIAEIENNIATSKEHRKKLKQKSSNKLQGRPKPAMRLSCRVCGGQHDSLFCPERYTTPPPVGRPCRYCGQEGHWSMNCSTQSRTRRLGPEPEWHRKTCPHCGRDDHYNSDCPELKGRKKVAPPILSLS